MTPEAIRSLAKARKLLEHAGTMLDAGLNEDAGRAAYLAGFHAAQTFTFAATQKVLKSHKGVKQDSCA